MSDFGNLVERLERLERSNLRLRLAIGAIMAGFTIVIGLGAASNDDAKVLQAENIILRGEGGKIIAQLSSDPVNHDPRLTLWSNDERSRMTIGHSYLNYGERDEEAVKINAAYKSRITLRFNDDNEFFAKVREPR